MSEITKMQEQRLLRDIVSPMHCERLLELGVKNGHVVYWRFNPTGTWQLWSYQFDPMHYYEETDQLIFDLSPHHKPLRAVAAFSTGDMLSALPGLIITSTGPANYEVGVDSIYGPHSECDQRLPDALARLLIRLLEAKVYEVDYVNAQIIQP